MTGPPGEARAPDRLPAPLLPVLLLLVAAAYLPSYRGEFQLDDYHALVENPAVKDLTRFASPGAWSGWGRGARPVADLTLALDYRMAGLAPLAYHATNVAIHLAVVVLVYLFTARTTARAGLPGGRWPALLVAGLFGLHPIQTQAVSYVVQRAESLAALFYLLSLLLLLRAEEAPTRARGVLGWLGATASMALGLAAKMTVVTVPAAYVLHGLAFPGPADAGRGPWRRAAGRFALVAPWIAGAALLALANLRAFRGRQDAGFDIEAVPALGYHASQGRVLLRYLGLVLWPAGQNLDPEFALSRGLGEPRTVFALATAGFLAGGAALLLRWSARGPGAPDTRAAARMVGFGVLWFFLVLAPTSALPLSDLVVEHRVYLASWGIFAALTSAGTVLLRRLAPGPSRARWGAAAFALVLGALAFATLLRNEAWSTRLALWTDVVARSPRKARPHANLAHALLETDRLDGAFAEYRRALDLAADETVQRNEVLMNMGSIRHRQGRLDEAEALYREGLAWSPRSPGLLNDLAIVEMDRGHPVEARALVDRALESVPGHGGASNTLGELLARAGDAAGALSAFERAVAADPDVALRHFNVALTLARLGRVAEACETWTRYLSLEKRPEDRVEGQAEAARLGCPGVRPPP